MKKITVAEDDRVDQFSDIVQEILQCIGHPEALVTDESMLSDFCLMDEEEEDTILINVATEFEMDVSISENLADLAEKIYRLRIEEGETGASTTH